MNAHAVLHNLYQYRPMTTALSRKHLQANIDDALNRPASAYDSHPSPMDRFNYVGALPIDGEISMVDYATEAWSLFTNRKSIELEMTDVIRMTVREQTGVEIPAGTDSKPTDAVQDVVLEPRH
jgi:hypothetical protein